MINLLSPWSLLIFLPVGALIVLLYLLKLKRKERIISSVMLWQAAVADLQANAPLQKLNKNLLLFLQLLILILIVIAASRPFRNVEGLGQNRIVVIVDASASMQTTDVGMSRFEKARQQASSMADSMGPGDSMLVISAGTKPQVLSSFSSDKRSIARDIRSLKPTDASCDMRQALVLAASLVAEKSSKPARIIVLSDGAFGKLDDTPLGMAKVDYRCIGNNSDNVGITGISSRKSLSGSRQVFVGMQNYSNAKKKFNLELYANDQLVDVREQSLAPGQSHEEILESGEELGGRITAKLDIKDDLDVDNSGTVYLDKPRKISVLLLSKGNVFLQNAINLDTRTQLVKTDSLPADYKNAAYDITIFDGIRPPQNLPAGGYLLVNTSTSQGPADEGAAVTNPTIIDSNKQHPVSRYVDFAGVRIASARYLTPKFWGDQVLEGSAGSLCVAGSHDKKRFVQLSWSLLDSDFPMRVGFPIFMANCIDYLAGTNGEGAAFTVRTGQPASIDLPAGIDKLTVTAPDGTTSTINSAQSPALYDGTQMAGVYTYTAGPVKGEFAANLASDAESNLKPVREISLGEHALATGKGSVRTNTEFYWPMLFIALAVLTFEWYAYHRRL